MPGSYIRRMYAAVQPAVTVLCRTAVFPNLFCHLVNSYVFPCLKKIFL